MAWVDRGKKYCDECKVCLAWRLALHPLLGTSRQSRADLNRLAHLMSQTSQFINALYQPGQQQDVYGFACNVFGKWPSLGRQFEYQVEGQLTCERCGHKAGESQTKNAFVVEPPEAGQQTNQTVLAALFETSRPEFVECPSCRAGGAARKIDHTISLPNFVLVVANKNKARMRHTTSNASLKLRFTRRKK